MNVVGALRQILLDDATTLALLADVTAIYPLVLPQQKVYPAVTLYLGDLKANDSKTQVSGVDNVQIMLNVFAKSYDTVQKIATATRNAIDGFSGSVTTSDLAVHNIDAVRLIGMKDDFDSESVLFIRQVEYDVRYLRDVPPIPFGAPYVSESKAWMDLLPVYDSDESAVADGLVYGDVYMTADNHNSAPGGMPKQVRIPNE